ncbi:MAG TPA: hypothetical protein VFQ61_28320 [Polyangiaceae bacterium]|nr:hypothetical protein [Polyangiaceae bacterium]
MTLLALGLLALQGTIMLVDEFHFHRARGLPRWERIGHPLDTLSVLACYAVALALPATRPALIGYAALAAFSCLFITKDEFVHARECQPAEHFLHALLFVLHPLVLGSAAWLWYAGNRALLWGQAGLTLGFLGYQVAYWNFSRATR